MSRPKGFKHTPETIEKMRQTVRKRWSNPEFREKQKQAMQEGRLQNMDKIRQTSSETLKNNWKDPDWRDNMSTRQSEGARARWADPEKRAAILAARKAAYEKKKGLK